MEYPTLQKDLLFKMLFDTLVKQLVENYFLLFSDNACVEAKKLKGRHGDLFIVAFAF